MPQSSTLYVGLEGHKEWSVLLHHIIAQYQNIHARAQEAVEGLSRPVHDGLILVERGIEEYWDARQLRKRFEELPVVEVCLALYGLEPARAINVCDGRGHNVFLGLHRVDLDHERIGHCPHKIVWQGFL